MSEVKQSEAAVEVSPEVTSDPQAKPAKSPRRGEAAKAAESKQSGAKPAEPKQPKQPKGDKPANPKSPPGQGSWASGIALVALLLAVAGLGGGYYLWQQLQAAQAEQRNAAGQLREQLGAQTGAIRQELHGELQSMRETLASLSESGRFAADERERLGTAIRDLGANLSGDRNRWAVAEVEYLLIISGRRVGLERDVASAAAALEAADARLRTLDDPAYQRVRQSIARELQALREVPALDRPGLVSRLGALSASIDGLPLGPDIDQARQAVAEPAGTEAPVADWRGFMDSLGNKLRGLVTIRRGEANAIPLMAPEQRYFLRQNLRLKVETARLALLQHDPVSYRGALTEADAWLDGYFDPESASTQAFRDSLAQLMRVDVKPKLPEISESLRLLRQIEQQAGRTAEARQ